LADFRPKLERSDNLCSSVFNLLPQGCRGAPTTGLKFANAFGVISN
jgi:hypothetical protein